MVYEIENMEINFYREIAKEVTNIDDNIRQLLDDMVETMYATDGVGLAAPQIGHSMRMFVCDDGTGKVE